MSSAILDLVKMNEKIDYTFLIPLVILYFLIFWLIVSLWVYVDTKKRIKRKRFRILIFFLNLIFGLPFMLLYLLARPYDNDEMDEISGEGVNVPIINFVGKDGMVMALELKILPTGLVDKNVAYDANMRIGVNIESPHIIGPKKVEIEKVEEKIIPIKEENKKDRFNIVQYVKNLFEFKDSDNKKEDEKDKNDDESKDEDRNASKKMKKKANKKRNR